MQFDPNMMKAFLSLDDSTLWQTVRTIAKSNGIDLPEGKPPAAELARLRQTLSGKGSADVNEALRIVKEAQRRHE